MSNKASKNLSLGEKGELVNQLVSFVVTDTLLFLPRDKAVISIVQTLNDVLNTVYVLSTGIEVSSQNEQQSEKIKQYLDKLSCAEVAFIYQVGKELHSVLLAVLLNVNKISLQQAFEFAFYEELCQQKEWGKTEEIVKRQQDIWKRLTRLCEQYDKRSVS